MLHFIKILLMTLLTFIFSRELTAQDTFTLPLDSKDGLTLINVKAEKVELNGKEGLRVSKADDVNYSDNNETIVLVEGTDFRNGTIELEITGEPAPDAPPQSRGFVGVAFHIDSTREGDYECFYLRPTNGRATDQLQRNHSVQYISHPDYPWHRLRSETPGVYESYVDLVPGEWTKIKIVVSGLRSELFVHDSTQPVLIVNDLKKGEKGGKIGLWLHKSTIAHFRNLKIDFAD